MNAISIQHTQKNIRNPNKSIYIFQTTTSVRTFKFDHPISYVFLFLILYYRTCLLFVQNIDSY